jgi:RNA polymerase sigma-70 factor (ECF subfamily)
VKLESREIHNIFEVRDETSSKHERLYRIINTLSDIDKAIITLYLDEFSYKEIAEIIGISEVNTGVKINRIKSIILKSFENGNQ